jgi:hypothetical protein
MGHRQALASQGDSWSKLSQPTVRIQITDLTEHLGDSVREQPVGIVGSKGIEIANPPAVIADARLVT